MSKAKDVVAKAIAKVTPGQHLTKLPGPRVLVEDPTTYRWGPSGSTRTPGPYDANDLADRLRSTVPTVEVIRGVTEVNLNEWDCIVTTVAPTDLVMTQGEASRRGQEPPPQFTWSARYPAHMSLICVVPSGGLDLLDAHPATGEEEADMPAVAMMRDPDTVGSHLRQVDGLPESIASIVSRELLPVARGRNAHSSFRRWRNANAPDGGEDEDTFALRPFMLGPDDIALAGSYERNGNASAWLLPNDLPDIYPWVIEALREWHSLYPDRFPAVPDWQGADDWRSSAEAKIAAERAQLGRNLKAEIEKYQAAMSVLDEQEAAARSAADAYQRALLTSDGDALSDAVGCALAALGFHVVDMDQHWAEGDRREDLRVFDDGDPDWVAIVEVKGTKHGPKETEVQNFGRWVERFILDEQRAPAGRWFVTNHQRGVDPSARQEPFGNKSAVVTTFAASGGTIIDTRALFDLIRLVEAEPGLMHAARALLKARPPLLVRVARHDLEAGEG